MIDHTSASSLWRRVRPRGAGALGSAVALIVASGFAVSADEGSAWPIEVEVEGLIAAPPSDVRAVLVDLERFGEWFPAIGEWRVIARPRHDVAYVYGRQDLPWPVSDRDYVVEYRVLDEDDGFRLVAVARPRAEPAPPSGVVRVERMRTEWQVVTAPEGSRVRYRYEGDSGGSLPAFVARAGWRARTPLVVERLREEVMRRGAARSAPATPESANAAPEARGVVPPAAPVQAGAGGGSP